ncbi:holin [Fusobacterium necrophorum]|uniref:Holin n=1 Tax=Fusobacterium necrophorum TaxID=859 RepID=A0A4Q2KZU9_9FUSO|nr:phage holin family protein [Fusobacterium necrophorum]RXZ70609.1 holin [Fusobacterium necrophorum]
MHEIKVLIKEIFLIFHDVIDILLNGYIWMYSLILFLIFSLTGGEDKAIKAVLIAMLIDYISGIIKAIYSKNLSSKTGVKGIIKKIMILMVITAAHQIDLLLGLEMIKINMRFITICFYCSNEVISLLENVSSIGIPVPKQLVEILEQCKNKKIK